MLVNSPSRNVAAYGYLGPRIPDTSPFCEIAYNLLYIDTCERARDTVSTLIRLRSTEHLRYARLLTKCIEPFVYRERSFLIEPHTEALARHNTLA